MKQIVVADSANVRGRARNFISRVHNQHIFIQVHSTRRTISITASNTNISRQLSHSRMRSSPTTKTPGRKSQASATKDSNASRKRKATDQNDLDSLENSGGTVKKPKARTKAMSALAGSSSTNSTADGAGEPAARGGNSSSPADYSRIAEEFAAVKGQHYD